MHKFKKAFNKIYGKSPDTSSDSIQRLYRDKNTTSITLVALVRGMFGNGWLALEPETIRLDIRETIGAIPAANVDTILAAQTLYKRDFAFWDANVFENTILSLNKVPPKPELLQKPSLARILWGLRCMDVLLSSKSEITEEDIDIREYFDYEPRMYLATLMKHRGLVCVPPYLSFMQPELDRQVSDHPELCEKVKNEWAKISDKDLKNYPFKETQAGKHLSEFATGKLFVSEQKQRLTDEMATVTNDLTGTDN